MNWNLKFDRWKMHNFGPFACFPHYASFDNALHKTTQISQEINNFKINEKVDTDHDQIGLHMTKLN